MKVINKSRKIIAINGEPFLPGTEMELSEEMEKHPSILEYLKKGVVADVNTLSATAASTEISDFERAKIAEEAVARYKAEQEALAAAQAEKDAEIKAVNKMKKEELISKAIGMSIEIADSDTVEIIKGKIFDQLNQ